MARWNGFLVGSVVGAALLVCLGAAPATAGCGDGEVDAGEQCDPPGAGCTNPVTLTAGTCSSQCTCDLPQCGGDCNKRCDDVRSACEQAAEKLRGVGRKACAINEKSAKQLCDESEVTSELSCTGFCPGSPEYQACRSAAKSTRGTCREQAQIARDACKLNQDTLRDQARAACDLARATCEDLCN